MFEKIIRLKLRFDSPQGALSVEDLWDIPLKFNKSRANLNDVAKEIARQLKTEGEEDFVNPKSGADDILQLKLDAVKYVIHVRQEENENARIVAERKEKKERLKELIAKKQDQQLEAKSMEELQEMISAL